MNNQPSQNLSRRDLCAVIFRHKKKVLFIPLAAILVGALVLLYFPRTYRSEAQVFLRLGRENIGLDPTATTGQTIVTQNSDRKDEVASVMDVIQSRGVIAKAVDQVGAEAVLSDGAPRKSEANGLSQAVVVPLQVVSGWLKEIDPISDRERAIIKVEKSLRVLADRGSTLISMSCDAKTPQAAQSLCSAIVEVYQQEHMRIHRSEDSRPFFAEQHDRLRKQLDDSLEALRNVKNEKGLPSVEERRQTLEAQFSAVELARLNTQQQIAMSDARIVELERQLAEMPERLIDSKKNMPNSGADLLRQQLYNLQMKSMDMEARYSDAHPLVVAVNEQVQEAQRVLAQQTSERTETTDSINPIHRQLSLELKQIRSQYAGLKSTLVELNDQKESVLADLRALNDNELTIDQLSRQAELRVTISCITRKTWRRPGLTRSLKPIGYRT